jgi:malonyl-CoA O-methyltransferase
MWRDQRVFVTGTDTGVGKTVVAACLVRLLGAQYWKPVQTGVAVEEGDTETVMRLAGVPRSRVFAPRFTLAAPLSPEAASLRENIRIGLQDFALPNCDGPLVVEGAGGVLVPLGGGALLADLMQRLGLPAVLVARSTLGTINHCLLSIEALRQRGIVIAGVVMVGPPSPGNAEAIAQHGKIRILAQLPWQDALNAATLQSLVSLLENADEAGL